MGDPEDLEIDVCTIDEENAKNLHSGLTIVAAETFITNSEKIQDPVIPLSEDDLLGKVKHSDSEKIVNQVSLDKKNKKNTFNISSEKVSASSTCTTEKPSVIANVKKDIDINVLKEANLKVSTFPHEVDRKVTDNDILDSGVNNVLNRFSFESDHLALKDNIDYHALLRTLALLEAQQIQAIKDLEKLHELKEEALADPLKFVKNLQEKKLSEFPKRQVLVELPLINWHHYMTAYVGNAVIPQIATRNTLKSHDKDVEFSNDEDDSQKGKLKIKIEDKNASFKQKWTAEEQVAKHFHYFCKCCKKILKNYQPLRHQKMKTCILKILSSFETNIKTNLMQKLEKLLIMFPPEEVDARRWEKIANALGNRTAAQVASRIQKYFLKLAKANMPIPGRGPSLTQISHFKRKKINPSSFRNSTFFPSWKPSMSMDENDDDPVKKKWKHYDGSLDDDDIPASLKNTPEYEELMELKLLRRKYLEKDEDSCPIIHEGYMCDGCKVNPIVGVRWHCATCLSSVDFCNNCAQIGITTESHKSDHNLTPLTDVAQHQTTDTDYVSFEHKNKMQYNYLDPNFAPGGSI